MNAEDWIALASVLATTCIALFTLWIHRRDAAKQSEREDEIRRQEQEREERRRETAREHVPHVEFTIECSFFASLHEQILIEVRLVAHNIGQVIQQFSRISLRIRGIPRSGQLERWEGRGDRAFFPVKIAEETNIIPAPQQTLYFTEPGVRQVFTYVTTVPVEMAFILVFAEFDYYGELGKTHDCERVFAVPLGG